ncbi:MAG TPA: 2-dehydropantoate 2-reductase [Burkholderiaceae bacterium]|nr:2-dehydropantoate 2-reductase [Burkholderiaceae bacterium]
MGAGAIGCYLGGRLQAAGAQVHFVGRPRVLEALRTQGLGLSDLDGWRVQLAAADLALHAQVPEDMAPALVLLTVKSGATAEAAAELAARLPAGTPVISMQNGVSNARIAQQQAPGLRVWPGMVPYNVAELAPGRFHRGTAGALAAQDDAMLRGWLPLFQAAGLDLHLHADMRSVQWGKLLLNLNNPVNALSGLPLRRQLLDRELRRCTAALIDEALGVLKAAGIAPARVAPVRPAALPRLMRLPTLLFRVVAARSLRIDAKARSSMADDLALDRPTEVDALCGEVVSLARSVGGQAPRNARMTALVKDWPQTRQAWTGAALRQALQAP